MSSGVSCPGVVLARVGLVDVCPAVVRLLVIVEPAVVVRVCGLGTRPMIDVRIEFVRASELGVQLIA